jgi:hypothetical protein
MQLFQRCILATTVLHVFSDRNARKTLSDVTSYHPVDMRSVTDYHMNVKRYVLIIMKYKKIETNVFNVFHYSI